MRLQSLILSLIVTIFATSCGVNYHVQKAIKKGYRCDTVADTIRITSVDSIPYVVNDSIVWEKILVQKDTIVQYKTSFVPLTRYQERIRYKLKRDTIRQVQKIEVAKYKSQKEKPTFWVLILGFVIGMGTMYLFRYSKSSL
jgi:hypothetical protein